MNRTALAQRIKTLAGLTDDERSDLLTLLNDEKTYGLTWETKPEQVEEDLRDKLPVLREVTERRIVARRGPAQSSLVGTGGSNPSLSVPASQLEIDLTNAPINEADQETTETATATAPHHLLIEGDNLHALTVLNYTHIGKVDVIYIDPPYNTGNKDFKYNDRFVDREDSYRHSKWLSFMHKRLELARTLLKPEGVIFISIDDNEQAQLKLLCDRVFGEENCLSNMTWKKSYGGGAKAKHIVGLTEYVLCYANLIENIPQLDLPPDPASKKYYTGLDEKFETRGPFRTQPLATNSMDARPNLRYPIIYEGEEVWPEKQWQWSKGRVEEALANNELLISKVKNKWSVRYKQYLISDDGSERPAKLFSLIEGMFTQDGTNAIKDMFDDGKAFSFPKPLALIKLLLSTTWRNKNALILDFFAGSGTTLHAVMDLNAEDGGNRQCILVTNNENNIAEEVCYERNRRVIEGYTNSKGAAVPGLTNNHLHYYQTTYVGRERTLPNKRELMRLATELLCIKEGCYTEQAQAAENVRLFTNDTQTSHVVVVCDEDAIADTVAVIQNITPTQALVKVYVFAPGFYPYTDDFEEVADRIDLVALPEAIYQAYARLLPPMGKPVPIVDDVEPDTTLPTVDLSLFPANP